MADSTTRYRDLRLRLESTSRAEILATYHSAGIAGGGDLPRLERLLGTPGSNLLGATLYRSDGSEVGRIGAPPELTLERARSQGQRRMRSPDGRVFDVL